ncbi:MAG: hypothetical protein KBD66_00040 [Candidatus Doudnabacteria bacterium]|nr:hypothetical protein [Candidatus Doudnabacteria bacterium]
MTIFIALLAALALALGLDRLHDKHSHATHQNRLSSGIHKTSKMVPHALTTFIMVAHASEITRVVSHVSALHIVAAVSIFAIWIFTNNHAEEL